MHISMNYPNVYEGLGGGWEDTPGLDSKNISTFGNLTDLCKIGMWF